FIRDKEIEDISDQEIVNAMVGRELSTMFPDKKPPQKEVALSVEDLLVDGAQGSVNFEVFKGEVFGLAGLVGAGRTELLETIFGHRTPIQGTIKIDGNILPPNKITESIEMGIALVPEDRKGSGLITLMNVL